MKNRIVFTTAVVMTMAATASAGLGKFNKLMNSDAGKLATAGAEAGLDQATIKKMDELLAEAQKQFDTQQLDESRATMDKIVEESKNMNDLDRWENVESYRTLDVAIDQKKLDNSYTELEALAKGTDTDAALTAAAEFKTMMSSLFHKVKTQQYDKSFKELEKDLKLRKLLEVKDSLLVAAADYRSKGDIENHQACVSELQNNKNRIANVGGYEAANSNNEQYYQEINLRDQAKKWLGDIDAAVTTIASNGTVSTQKIATFNQLKETCAAFKVTISPETDAKINAEIAKQEAILAKAQEAERARRAALEKRIAKLKQPGTSKTPEQAIIAYMTANREGNLEKLCSTIRNNSNEKQKIINILGTHKESNMITNLKSTKMTPIAVQSKKVNGNTADIVYKTSVTLFGDTQTVDAPFGLVKENGVWYIATVNNKPI